VTPSLSVVYPQISSVAAGFNEFVGVYSENIKFRNVSRIQNSFRYKLDQRIYINSIPSTLHYSYLIYKNDFLSFRIRFIFLFFLDRSLYSLDR
jgi:hypothetical protein